MAMAMVRMATRFGGGPSLLCTPGESRGQEAQAGSAPHGLSYAAVMQVPNKCHTSAIQVPYTDVGTKSPTPALVPAPYLSPWKLAGAGLLVPTSVSVIQTPQPTKI